MGEDSPGHCEELELEELSFELSGELLVSVGVREYKGGSMIVVGSVLGAYINLNPAPVTSPPASAYRETSTSIFQLVRMIIFSISTGLQAVAFAI